MPRILIHPDVIHLIAALACRRTSGRVDVPVKFLLPSGLSYVDDRYDLAVRSWGTEPGHQVEVVSSMAQLANQL